MVGWLGRIGGLPVIQQRPPERHRHVSDTRPELLSPPPRADLNRRTILQGAAWTIPAIAVATVAPAASASTNAVLAFNQASYSGTACGTITGAYVTVTVGGVPTAGRSVTTTLSDGYTFAGGSTTDTQVSDTNGRVTLPAINVPAGGGNATTSATTGVASASASILAPSVGSAYRYVSGGGTSSQQSFIPAGSTPLGESAYLSSDNKVYWGSSTPIASGVSEAFASRDGYRNVVVDYVLAATGQAYRFVGGGGTALLSTIPLNSTPIGQSAFIAPNNDLNWGGRPTIATGISKAVGTTDGSNVIIDYISAATGAAYRYVSSSGTSSQLTFVPANSTPLGESVFLSPDNKLYWGSSTPIASGVSKAFASRDGAFNVIVDYVLASTGQAYRFVGGGGTALLSTIPLNSTPIGQSAFIAPNNDLNWGGRPTIANGVSKAVGTTDGSNVIIDYVLPTACS